MSETILFVVAILLIGFLMYGVFCWAPGRESRKEEYDHCRCCGYNYPKGWRVCPNCLVYTDKSDKV